jgi:hypothetical protein
MVCITVTSYFTIVRVKISEVLESFVAKLNNTLIWFVPQFNNTVQ